MASELEAAFSLFDVDGEEEGVIGPAVTSTVPPVDTASRTPQIFQDWAPDFVAEAVELDLAVDGIGGSRGLKATRAITPGTLLLAERPCVTWDSSPRDDHEMAITMLSRTLTQLEETPRLLQSLALLHPVSLDDIPAEDLDRVRQDYADAIAEQTARGVVEENEVVRLLLASRSNAFASGFYLHFSMFNHSCDPNCIKFSPESSASGCSEVRATQHINAGEALTISYLHPREATRRRRQEMLKAQFFFDCACSLCTNGKPFLESLACVDWSRGCLGEVRPPNAQCTECSKQHEDIAGAMEIVYQTETRLDTVDGLLLDGNATLAMQELLDILSEALGVLHLRHIVLARLHKLVAEACDRVLGMSSAPQQGQIADAQREEITLAFIRSCLELKETQAIYLDVDHPDCGRTANDLRQSIQAYLRTSPESLYANFPELNTFAAASAFEAECRRIHQRVSKKYESKQMTTA